MSASVPATPSNPLTLLWQDVRDERRTDTEFPPGEKTFSLPRTRRFEQPLAKVLVPADVARARDQYDCCVSSLLEPDVERLVEQVVLSDECSPSD